MTKHEDCDLLNYTKSIRSGDGGKYRIVYTFSWGRIGFYLYQSPDEKKAYVYGVIGVREKYTGGVKYEKNSYNYSKFKEQWRTLVIETLSRFYPSKNKFKDTPPISLDEYRRAFNLVAQKDERAIEYGERRINHLRGVKHYDSLDMGVDDINIIFSSLKAGDRKRAFCFIHIKDANTRKIVDSFQARSYPKFIEQWQKAKKSYCDYYGLDIPPESLSKYRMSEDVFMKHINRLIKRDAKKGIETFYSEKNLALDHLNPPELKVDLDRFRLRFLLRKEKTRANPDKPKDIAVCQILIGSPRKRAKTITVRSYEVFCEKWPVAISFYQDYMGVEVDSGYFDVPITEEIFNKHLKMAGNKP